jgi:hypothetical protein
VNETQTGVQQRLSPVSTAGSIDELLADFDRHLERQRSCTEGTRKHYQRAPQPAPGDPICGSSAGSSSDGPKPGEPT